MFLIFSPEGGKERRWDLDKVRPTLGEVKAAERAGSFKWKELREELQSGNVEALQATLWVLRRRDEPDLKFIDLESLVLDEVAVQFSKVERDLMRSLMRNDPNLDDEGVEAALDLFAPGDDEDGEAEAAEKPDPKETTGATPTS